MLEGKVDLILYDAPNFGDARFQRAIKEGTLDKLLGALPVAQRVEGRNMVFNWFAAWTFSCMMGGGSVTGPYRYPDSSASYLGSILLSTRTEDPTYTEYNNDYCNVHNPSYTANSGSAGKRFLYELIESMAFFVDPGATGRGDISSRSRWLYLPSEGNSSDIRSLGVLFTDNRDLPQSSQQRASAARLRFKNSVGAPITIVKTSNQVLLVEYTFKLVSV